MNQLKRYSQDNLIKVQDIFYPYTKCSLTIKDEDYLKLDLDEDLLLFFSFQTYLTFGVKAQIKSFERLMNGEVILQIITGDIIRFISFNDEKNEVIIFETSLQFDHFEHQIGYLIDELALTLDALQEINSNSTNNLREKIVRYHILFKEAYFMHNILQIRNLIFGLAYHVIKSRKNRMLMLALSFDNKIDLLIKSLISEVESIKLDIKMQKDLRDKLQHQQKNFLILERIKSLEDQLNNKQQNYHNSKLKSAPDHFKKIFEKEYRKLNSLPRNSPEFPQQKKLIECMRSLPWKSSELFKDFDKIKETLDRSHFGLQKVKDEIMDYLFAVQKSKNNYNKVLCLVGGAGLGKSSISRSIATALKREFIKISLAGANDSNLILGSSKVFINSQPGSIINSMTKLKFNNPVILIDEVDKTINRHSNSGGTSIEYALLDLLDSENNQYFKDHFLDEEYPLNKVLFIATANSLEDIPTVLLNRLTIINIDSYNQFEKLEIAKNWILPSIYKMLNLKIQYSFSDQLILDIINFFTLEAGVRKLKQKLEKIILWCSRGKLEESKLSIEYLKNQLKWNAMHYDTCSHLQKPLHYPGRMLGMYAYMDYGVGGITILDVNSYNSKENSELLSPIITGSAGKVMQESVKQAMLAAFLWLVEKKLITENKIFQKKWVVHYGDTSSSKEGPSGGLSASLAFISSILNIPNRDIAITGEINMRGEVLIIGGLQEKTSGALRHNITELIFPKGNENHFNLVDKKLRDLVKVYFVSSLEEAVKIVWPNLKL